jgi:PAS domain S-box-containing protein
MIHSRLWQESGPEMEFHLFRLLCLSATVSAFFVVIPTNYLHHLPTGVNVAVIVLGLGTLVLCRESCLGRHHISALFLLVLLVLNAIWFGNGGSLGSVGFYFFSVLVYAMIFFRGKVRWLLVGVVTGDLLGLLGCEKYFPQWLIPYQNSADREADIMIAVGLNILYCSLMLWAVLTSYDREQRRLIGLNEELERNMAKRLQAESLLRQNREIFNALIEGTCDAIYAKDPQGRYLVCNGAAAQLIGMKVSEVLGADDTALFPLDEADELMAQDREILASGELKSIEHTLSCAGGEKLIFQATKGPLRDERGNIIGVFGISRNVTESRRVAEELGKLTNELELRVAERTALLEAAMQEQESFSYSVSHDLRGPLRHINCYAAILEEEFGDCFSDRAREYLDRIRCSSRRMGQLIDDLLELSRIGRSELSKGPVSLSRLACSISDKLREAEPERRVELVVEAGLTVKGDQVLLRQMLENLIGNAWKYSSRRECSRIEVGRKKKADREVFFVKDNGVGFDMAYQDKLFGAFQRLHGSEFEGAGIGLATVKRIVERHGGSVWAEAAIDEGATIYFTLP